MHPVASSRAFLKALISGAMFLSCACLMSAAHAGSARGHDGKLPQTFNRIACYQLVQNEGRLIAWARWEQNFTEAKTRTAEFQTGTPAWMVELVEGWIEDAYHWQVTDDQVYQWAQELGSTDNLPHADQLTNHQTIAIWMRRISRQCDEHEADAGKSRVAEVPASWVRMP